MNQPQGEQKQRAREGTMTAQQWVPACQGKHSVLQGHHVMKIEMALAKMEVGEQRLAQRHTQHKDGMELEEPPQPRPGEDE